MQLHTNSEGHTLLYQYRDYFSFVKLLTIDKEISIQFQNKIFLSYVPYIPYSVASTQT